LFLGLRDHTGREGALPPSCRGGCVDGAVAPTLSISDARRRSALRRFISASAIVDVIVTVGDLAIRTAQEATKTIPILAATDDMLGAGLVNSLARPNGNTTGLSILATELDGKRQEILIEAVPGMRHMATLADANRTSAVKLEALQEAARARNIEFSIHRITTGADIPIAVETAQVSGATALNVLASEMLYANRQLIMDRAAAMRMAAIPG
jgi:putative tryptophan/tyrosine transport system substrate-binding protein